MSDVYVYQVELPPGINEAVTPGADDSYTIYIDARLSDREKLEAYYHALRHCEHGDFEREDAQVIEYENHQDEKGLYHRHKHRPG